MLTVEEAPFLLPTTKNAKMELAAVVLMATIAVSCFSIIIKSLTPSQEMHGIAERKSGTIATIVILDQVVKS